VDEVPEQDPVLVAEVPELALDPEVQAVEELAAECQELEPPVALVLESLAALELLVVLLVVAEVEF
jgi:hypothetical protein